MSILDWAWFMPSDIQPLPKYRKRVRERTEAGLCLDNRDGCECNQKAKKGRRQLCGGHAWKFRTEVMGKPKSRRKEYETNRILNGTIAAPRSGQGGGRPRKQEAVA